VIAVASVARRRKVLVIEDEPSIRNVIYVLLAGLGCDGDVASDSQHALAMIEQDRFDAVLLDLRSAHLPADQMVSAITELRPSLLGRVLVITGEVSDPDTLEMLEKFAVPYVSRSRMTSDLWSRMRVLLSFTPSPADSSAH
jgi:DNA-binding response OmpR family regulator